MYPVSLYAIKVLRSQGMSDDILAVVFKSVVLVKILYASPAWCTNVLNIHLHVLFHILPDHNIITRTILGLDEMNLH